MEVRSSNCMGIEEKKSSGCEYWRKRGRLTKTSILYLSILYRNNAYSVYLQYLYNTKKKKINSILEQLAI